jgi:outer membrane receptor protein involved in Fe transport
MSPFHLAGVGLLYAPASGLNGNVQVNYVGERYMDKRNRALADAYTAWNAGVGYRFGRHELRVDGRNLGDTRPPVAESELGDAQYYRLPARSYEASYRLNF